MNTNNLLGFFVKFPETGKVKTRLAKEIGFDNAAKAYKMIAERVLVKTYPDNSDYERLIFYSPGNMKVQFRNWLYGERLIAQKGRHIGEKMSYGLRKMFDIGAGKAVITGVDIPELSGEIVRQAFFELNHTDIVIGPAMDGGYYLIGMKSLHADIFRNIPWSTDRVFEKTVSVIRKLKLKHKTLVTLFDVDRLDDLIKAREIFRDL